ncbi:E3 SUMO-protein ligase ZBED1-like [Rhinichthys klamathensis goyatoka]|nr:E3 SUMO-protein ligase ZBED1-like [Rhinichthys klamathensis goyatoka]
MPFQIVERPGFLRLMKVAVPHYKVPSRKYFSKTEIPNLYNQVKADVLKKLAQGTWFAATTDLWTSESGGGQPYISVTIHYLTPDWQLESNCLETQFFPEDHSAQNISEFFDNMLEEWGINKKDLVCITTDNATNMIKAFEEFSEVWLGCFGHNLNLAISKALKIQRVETAVKACRHLVQGFSRSWKRRRELRQKQAALNMPQKALIHDVVTRWGSTHKMVERFLSQQQPVCATLAGERGTWHLMPKDTDITVMEQLCQLLEPLSKLTDALASETRVTLSAIKPVLDHINSDVLVEKDTDTSLTKEMKKLMREDLKNRYPDKAKRVMNMACFIDPRFKRSSLDEPEASKIETDCVQEAVKLAAQVREEPQSTSTSSSISTSTPPAASEGKGLAGLLRKISSVTRQQRGEEGQIPTTLEDSVKQEIKVYLSLPPIPAEEDPLVWWKGHASELPHLARVARKLLCIPATSVPSERVFSASGHIVSPQRALLKPDKVNMLTFLHFNLK